jgi:hypothetical protein
VANVTEAMMESYLRTFHDEYVKTVEQYLPSDSWPKLMRYPLLPTAIIGYVSTKLGAGYEYVSGEPEISIRRGSQRIEDVFFDAPPWLRQVGPMFDALGSNTGIVGLGDQESPSTVEGAFPFRFSDERADVLIYNIRFRADGWDRYVLYAQLFADRREESWSEAAAVRRAKDEVLKAVFDLQQSRRRNVGLATFLRTFKQRTVLILGDFERRERLEAIRQELSTAGYDGVLLDEIPEEPDYDLPQKFQAVASVCRFLIFEDSTRSGHIAEMMLAGGLNSITIVLREGEQRSTFMTQGIAITSKVVREWSYEPESLKDVLTEALKWAEDLASDLQRQRNLTYPWRSDQP